MDPDRRTMELELSEKGLPEGTFDRPVAGYELEFTVGQERVLMLFPAGKKTRH